MDEVAGFDWFEPVPDAVWYDVGVARPQQNPRLGAHRLLVTVIEINSIVPRTTYRNSSPSGWTSPPCGPGPSTLGIAPIVYPSIRRGGPGGPGGAGVMVIVESRAIVATLPSKRKGDASEAPVMRTVCLICPPMLALLHHAS
jgi:hypothetical protein